MSEKLTTDERGVMLHTLGLDRSKESYRNHFCAGDDHDELPVIRDLCRKGFMEPRYRINQGRDMIYAVTPAGREALSSQKETGE